MVEVKFAKMHPDAKIPTKESENAGYDIYAAFDEDYMIIKPHETKMIPTGLCSAFSEDYVMMIKERGSTGTKGIGQRSGIVDAGYRGQWFVPLTNHNKKTLIITKLSPEETKESFINKMKNNEVPFEPQFVLDELFSSPIYYPYEKAIAQALLLPVPTTTITECTPEEIAAIPSKRGSGALGSSGK
jgi:dUTP pyrophosphatase